MRHGLAWLFLTGFTLAAMVYPMGKAPGTWDLGRVALPPILLVAAFIGFLLNQRRELTLTAGGERFSLANVASVSWFVVSALAICFVAADIAPHRAEAQGFEQSL